MLNRKNQDEAESAGTVMAAALRGIAAGIAAALITLAAETLLLTMPADPEPVIGPASTACMLIGALTAGITAARKAKGNPTAAAALAGVGIAAVLCIAAGLMGGTFRVQTALRCALCIGTALAGIIAVRKAKPERTVPRHPGDAARRRLARR